MTIRQAETLIKEGKVRKLPENKSWWNAETRHSVKLASKPAMVESSSKVRSDKSKMSGMRQTMQRVTAGGTELYGFVSYSEDETVMPIGLYYIERDGLLQMWEDKFYYSEFYSFDTGFYHDGKLIGCAVYGFMGYMFGYSRLEMDMETGELVSRTDYDFSNPEVITYDLIAYNSTDGFVYGIARNAEGEYHWYRTTLDNFGSGEDLGATNDGMTSLCYCAVDNSFYGTDIYGNFVKINVDGKFTNLFKIDLSNINFNYMSSMVYSPVEKLFFVNLCSKPYSYVVAIDAAKKEIVSQDKLPIKAQFSILATTDEESDDKEKPLAPVISNINFENGSTSGYVDFIMPSSTEEGTPIDGELRAFPSANNVSVGPDDGFKAMPGETLRVDFSDLPDGRNTFKIYVMFGNLRSRTATESKYIGNDTPLAPKNLRLTETQIKWSAVRNGVNNAYIARNEMKYKVYLNDEFICETEKTSVDISLPKDKEYTLYKAMVIAVCRGKESEPAYSNGIASGSPYNLPLDIVPTEEQAALCNIVNSDHDENMWWYNDHYEAFGIGYTQYNKADDWIVMPPFEAESTDKYYLLSFEINRIRQKYDEEFLSVYEGDSQNPASLTHELLAPFTPNAFDTQYEKRFVPFKVEKAGACFIGFHGTSNPKQNGMRLKNIRVVDNNITENSPAQVLNLDAQPFDGGVLKATVSFNLPRKTLFGELLDKDVPVSAVIVGIDTVVVSGRPGERMKVDMDTHQGRNTFSIMTKVGDFGSVNSEVSVVTGVAVPTTPVITGLTIAPDMQSMTMTWKPVTTGMDDGYVDPSGIKYKIMIQKETLLGALYWEDIADTGTSTTYTYTVEPGTPLDVVVIGVSAYNEAGNNGYVAAGQGQVGTPYTLPMADDFSNGWTELGPWLTSTPNSSYSDDYAIEETLEIGSFDTRAQYIMVGYGKQGQKGRLAVPRFTSMDLKNATMTCTVYTGSMAPPMIVYAGYQGAQKLLKMGEITPDPKGSDFTSHSFAVPEDAMGHYWVQIYIDSEFKNDDMIFMMQSISVTDEATGVESINQNDIGIIGGSGVVNVFGCAGKPVTVTSVDGRVFAHEIAESDSMILHLAKGVYIVAVGETAVKVLVK
ncbi:MAG: DUF6383 domain-containing protein [Lachnospiraceae bacterium]|nr:DUF6383 domain-containing protein [Lachnospiraceae bacterium]